MPGVPDEDVTFQHRFAAHRLHDALRAREACETGNHRRHGGAVRDLRRAPSTCHWPGGACRLRRRLRRPRLSGARPGAEARHRPRTRPGCLPRRRGSVPDAREVARTAHVRVHDARHRAGAFPVSRPERPGPQGSGNGRGTSPADATRVSEAGTSARARPAGHADRGQGRTAEAGRRAGAARPRSPSATQGRRLRRAVRRASAPRGRERQDQAAEHGTLGALHRPRRQGELRQSDRVFAPGGSAERRARWRRRQDPGQCGARRKGGRTAGTHEVQSRHCTGSARWRSARARTATPPTSRDEARER